MMRALMAFCWTEFGLMYVLPSLLSFVYKIVVGPDFSTCRGTSSGLYMISLFFLGKKHSTLPWTNRENPMSVPVGWLCPQQPKTEIIEVRPSLQPCATLLPSRVFQKWTAY